MAKRSEILFLVESLLFFICVSSVLGQGPIVSTTLGQVRGVVADDGDYTMFLGIPFAKVNEDNPFGAALPHPQYDGIFEANDDSAICPQEEEFNNTIVGTLDCLHLNVHVPNSASTTNLLPVFVWIFGGGFELGFYGRFLYGPKFLVRHDIIFVTINYRLGPYGFMCLDTPEVPGNQGLKDQLMALRWVRENIAQFGGNPNKITIAGNSAGSMSVDYHILRKNDGPQLFHQAILQSGTSYISNIGAPNKYAPLLLARNLGLETNDISEALAFLAKVDPLAVIEAKFELNLLFPVCFEKEFEGVEAFITEDPIAISDIPTAENVSVMIGFNDDEAMPIAQGGIGDNGQSIFLGFMALAFGSHDDFKFMLENVQKFYFGDESINDDQIQSFIDFMGDQMFIYPTFRSLKRFLDNNVKDLYLYKFSYDGGRNFVKHRENITGGGAAHADELGYLFDISYMDEPTPEDQLVIDGMTAMWANFVKYTDPTPQQTQLLPHKWEAITKDSPYHYLEIDHELRVGTRPLQERITFWDLFYDGFVINYNSTRHIVGDWEKEAQNLMRKILLYGHQRN